MKSAWICCILVLALAVSGRLPFRSSDVGQLRPVEVLMISRDGGIRLATDTGDAGTGPDLESALADLELTAPGTIFQGTVSFLLLEENALELLPQLARLSSLNPGCALCRIRGDAEPEAAAEYLRAHSPGVDLRLLRAGREELPVLICEDGRYRLVPS